jgi:secreted trypsin-like serine protease
VILFIEDASIGWGTLGFGEPASDVLMEVDFPIWSKTQCEDKLEQSIPDTQICAGSYSERKDACQGDSGGPLMHRLPNGRWISIGIVSYGKACGMKGQPGIYTRVNKYLQWIIDNTRL